MTSFPAHLQRNQMDCGPTCLYIICNYYKLNIAIEKLRELTEIGKEGVNMLGISYADIIIACQVQKQLSHGVVLTSNDSKFSNNLG